MMPTIQEPPNCWVGLDDAAPKKEGVYDVWLDDGSRWIDAEFWEGEFFDEWGYELPASVTHWMRAANPWGDFLHDKEEQE